MHPIEHLRYLARSSGIDDVTLAREAAYALASMPDDHAMLVVVCRRLIERQPTSAPLWWVCSRVLTSGQPSVAAWDALSALDEDKTIDRLLEEIGTDRSIGVARWSQVAEGLAGRPDLVLTDDVSRADLVVVQAVAASSAEVLVDEADGGLVAALSDRGLASTDGRAATEGLGVIGKERRLPQVHPLVDADQHDGESAAFAARPVEARPAPSSEHRPPLLVICPVGTRLAEPVVNEIARRSEPPLVVLPASVATSVVTTDGACPASRATAFQPEVRCAPELLLNTRDT